jgi:DNA-binding response OmpR family regulator
MKILLVEDDRLYARRLRSALAKTGFSVTWARNGRAAFDQLATDDFVAMVYDIGPPAQNGLVMLRELRARGRTLPVLALNSGSCSGNTVTALESGADDYQLKSAGVEELIARLRALIRRSGRLDHSFSFGHLRVDLAAHVVRMNGKPISISNREFAALRTLLEAAGRVVTRSQLETSLYGWGRNVDSNAVDVHIHNLRQKIGPETIKTVRGVGYIFAQAA